MFGEKLATAPTAAAVIAAIALVGCLCGCASAVAAGDADTASACPAAESSPGFRGTLPDCRAFELVTPIFDGGQPAFGIFHESAPVSANGEHLLGISFGDFAKTENLENYSIEYGAIYEFSRSSAGWAAEAMDPPAAEFPRSDFKLASADMSRSLWEVVLQKHSGEEVGVLPLNYDGFTLAVREQAGGGKGRFTLVGPVTAPKQGSPSGNYGVVGASADLSHIILSVAAEAEQLWPGDPTNAGSESLYEYRDVAGAEPVLVGVRNEGAPPWKAGAAHVNEGAQLVSDCGTRYNAVSASGEWVYFTALACGTEPLVNELDVRVDSVKTESISEPSPETCAMCETSKAAQEAAPEGATFAGASLDGSKVFFLSKQVMLPDAEAGVNNLYMYNADGPVGERVSFVAANVEGVTAVSEDGTRAYFQSTSDLQPGATNANGEEAHIGSPNLYVYDTQNGTTTFVGEASGGDRTTPDGQFLVFESTHEFAGTNDTSRASQLFEYNAETGLVSRVSIGQSAAGAFYECAATKEFEERYNCDGNTDEEEFAPKATGASSEGFFSKPTESTSHLTVAEDGTVVFTSALPLTPQAVSGRPIVETPGGFVIARSENVYEYRGGNVYLISPADEASGLQLPVGQTRLIGIDETGKDVFFATTDSLVPQDTDSQYSWYDAREEGGFPAPASTSECEGAGECQGAGATPLVVPGLGGSALAMGGQDLSEPAVVPTPAVRKPLSRAQKLQKALKVCAKAKNKAKRAACYGQARKRYGSAAKKASSRGGK
jgi:hypothetical protein